MSGFELGTRGHCPDCVGEPASYHERETARLLDDITDAIRERDMLRAAAAIRTLAVVDPDAAAVVVAMVKASRR